MRKYFYLFALMTILNHQQLFAQPGQAGLSFLKLGVGGRALGMGEAYSAIAADPTATYYNPAALSQSSNSQIMLMHKEWIQGVKTEYLGAMTTWKAFRFGMSINATNVNDIELRSIPGPAIGTFSARNAAIGFSTSYIVHPSLNVGITAKYLFEKILIEEASGLGIDIGATYLLPWNLRLAAAYMNMGSLNELANESSSLPKTFRAGGAYEIAMEHFDGVFTIASDIVSVTNESTTHLHLGAEFNYHRTFALRIGYQTGYEAKTFSTGVGIRYGILNVDYAFVPFRYDLGTTHTFSLGIEFN